MTNAQNPLLSDEFRIPFHEIRAEHVEPGIRQALEEAQAEIDAISDGTSPPTWATTLARMDAMSEVLGERFTPASHLVTVCESPELREAFGVVLPEISAFWSALPLNAALWKRVKRYAET
ncbi:MAG: M3 family peptidase, partial [Proteobacteria bacterium]|nr:M3 family peptidase [Pseudomonadota bacterium]